MRGDQLARQWHIIQLLCSYHGGMTLGELSRELNCSLRTIYRDLAVIQYAGFPLYRELVDRQAAWRFVDGYKLLLPVPFTLTELMALYFSRDIVKIFQGTIFFDSLSSLFTKVKNTLPPESILYLERIESTFQVGFGPVKDYSGFREIIRQVSDAAAASKALEIRYLSAHSGEENMRRVDPYRVWFYKGTLYLIGFCHLRTEVRMFAMDRIKMLSVTNETFTIPADFSLEKYLKDSFGLIHDEPVEVVIHFDARMARYVEEKTWHPSQQLEKQPDGSVLARFRVAGTSEIKNWVLSFGTWAQVLAPEELRRELADDLARMSSLYAARAEVLPLVSPAKKLLSPKKERHV